MGELLEFMLATLYDVGIGAEGTVVEGGIGGGEREVVLAHSLAEGNFARHCVSLTWTS